MHSIRIVPLTDAITATRAKIAVAEGMIVLTKQLIIING